VQVVDRPGIDLDGPLLDLLQDEPVLAISDAVDGLRVRSVVWGALGQGDATRGEEGAYAIGSLPAVDKSVVVVAGIERYERLPVLRGPDP
jgi:hypothetical protein